MRQVKTEAGTLTYELCRKRVKNLNLRVRADGSIAVSAPAGVAVAAVDEFVRRKAGWIAQVEQKLADRRLPDPEYGALLGHRVPLVVEPGPPGVWPRQGALYIGVEPGQDPGAALDAFRLQRAEPVFQRAMALARARFGQEPLPPVQVLCIRPMKSRWGSCIPAKGKVTLNAHLMKKPFACIEYVAAHELCHLLVPNHGPAFYQWMDRVMPDHRQRKAWLNQPDPGV